MIDIKLLIEQPEIFKKNNENRGKDLDIQLALSLSKRRSVVIEEVQKLRTRGNEIAEQIPSVTSEDARRALVEEGKGMKEEVKEKESELSSIEQELHAEIRRYPNLLREDVPVGQDAHSNELVRTVGAPISFSFEPKDHLELGKSLGVIDMDRAVKVSGARFAYLKGDAVLLELALVRYALAQTQKDGFIPILPPHLISTSAMSAMGYLEHGGEEEIYHLKNDDLVLIGTSEQAIGPMRMNELLDESQLPMRCVSFSPCYRREAGSYGKDTHGIFRVHQFDKVEMFSFTAPEASDEEHELILSIQERIMQGLKLPYRVMKLCSGDTGLPSARTYDIETWIPSQQTYRETHSTSNTTDFQTRRLNIRVRRARKNVFAHALNGTACAIGRTIIAILENYQQEDGSVLVPEVLQNFVGKERLGGA